MGWRRRIKCVLAVILIASSLSMICLFTIIGGDRHSLRRRQSSPLLTEELNRCIVFGQCNPTEATIQNASCCQDRAWSKPGGVFYLTDDTREYFRKVGNASCLIVGTKRWTTNSSASSCVCLAGWHGKSCSIPDSVWLSDIGRRTLDNVRPRLDERPRRIIHGFPFNHEFELLEARLAEYEDVVDVFMILESNYSAYGDPKPLRLLRRLQSGYLKRYSAKILHVFLGHFPAEAHANGWIEDGLLRDYLAQHGLKHQLKNYSSRDVFFLTDADELPGRDTLVFLKLHDGYPEPIGHYLSAHTFGFFWASKKDSMHIITSVSVGLLTQVLNSRAIQIRTARSHLRNNVLLNSYLKSHPTTKIQLWSFGAPSSPSGWHCSWCCKPECVRIKLLSAQNGDFPRWGDYPEKTKLTYIKHLIKTGLWFDDKTRLLPRTKTVKNYAPEYFLNNYDKYRHILENPYASHEAASTTPFQNTLGLYSERH